MKRVFSGIQPTGKIHLGNYLGAIKRWVELQNEYECIYSIVDLHALTMLPKKEELKKNRIETAIDLLACGIDPKRTILFYQSDVPFHTELAWYLACTTSMGDLERMTQFKEKSNMTSLVNAGLFTYPVLQAADILLYDAELVPVGEDQLQHIELARRIARRFNNKYDTGFVIPKPLVGYIPRIKSFQDPEKKMSKSLGETHYVAISENENSIRRKIKRAVTDMGLQERPEEMSPGVKNLFEILKVLGDNDVYNEMIKDYNSGKLLYGHLKEKVADVVIRELAPIKERRSVIEKDLKRVEEIMNEGAKRAKEIAIKVISRVRESLFL